MFKKFVCSVAFLVVAVFSQISVAAGSSTDANSALKIKFGALLGLQVKHQT